jgi:hypothetical protein
MCAMDCSLGSDSVNAPVANRKMRLKSGEKRLKEMKDGVGKTRT